MRDIAKLNVQIQEDMAEVVDATVHASWPPNRTRESDRRAIVALNRLTRTCASCVKLLERERQPNE